MPTFAYEYETALREGYLADYHCMATVLRIPDEGSHLRGAHAPKRGSNTRTHSTRARNYPT